MSSIKALVVVSSRDEIPREEDGKSRSGMGGGRCKREEGEGAAKRRKKISHSKRASALRENGVRASFFFFFCAVVVFFFFFFFLSLRLWNSERARASGGLFESAVVRANILILFSRKLRAIFAKPGEGTSERTQVCPRRRVRANRISRGFRFFRGPSCPNVN